MAAASKIQFLGVLIGLAYNVSAQAVAYTVSQSNTMLDGGIAFGPGNPIVLQNGDTLTISNGKNINFDPLAGTSMITAYGNNTITINTGSSIRSTQNVVVPPATAVNTNVINFVGSGSSMIIIASGATLQAGAVSNAANARANVFASAHEQVTLVNAGSLIGYTYFNTIAQGSNTLALLAGTLAVQNSINSTTLNPGTGVSNLWIGGVLDAKNKTTLTATTYTATTDYYPFTNIRVFAGSAMTLNAQTVSGPAVTQNLLIDATASFTLTGAAPAFPVGGLPVPASATLVVNNLQNAGVLAVANTYAVGSGGFRTLQLGTLANSGQINVTNGSKLIGIDPLTSSFTNAPAGALNITSGTLSGFNLATNLGSLTVNGTLANINTLNNNASGIVSLNAGATASNIGVINNASGASFQVNGVNFNSDLIAQPNYQTLAIINNGSFVIASGTLAMQSFTNNKSLVLSGGVVQGYTTSKIVNNLNATINATGGTLQNIVSITNYGTVNLAGVNIISTVTNIYNYNIINHSAGSLAATNLYNEVNATYNLTGNANITPPGGSVTITNSGVFNANTSGVINSSIINGQASSTVLSNASFNIAALATTYDLTNNANVAITGAVNFAPTAASTYAIANNSYLLLNGAHIGVTTSTAWKNKILNTAVGVVDVAGPLTLTFPALALDSTVAGVVYCNFSNDGVVNLKAPSGTLTYTNTGTNIFYTSSVGTLRVLTSTTLTGASYANQGVHYAFINSVDDPSTFTINDTANLPNCLINFDVNSSLTGSYTFKILDSTNIVTPPAGGIPLDTFLLKKNVVYNNSLIFAEYFRQSLVDPNLNLSPNALELAKAIEALLASKQMSDSDLNALYQNMYTKVTSAHELEGFLTNMLPIISTPIQNAVVQQAVFNQLDSRMQSTRIAYNSADYVIGFTPWVKYFSTVNRQNKTLYNIGYKFKSNGVVFGMDNYDGLSTQYGLSLTFARSLLEQHSNLPSNSRTHLYQANIYSQNIRPDNYYTDWIIGLAYSDTKQSRVDPNDQNTIAYSDYQWQQYSGKYEFGYIYDFSKEYYVIPYVSAHYTFLKSYKYKEYNNAPNNLYIQSPAKHILEAGMGVRAATQLLLYERAFTPKVNLGIKYCISAPVYTIDASIIDQSVVFQTFTKVPRLKYYAGVGLTFEIIENLSFSTNLDAEVYTNYLGVSYNFLLRYTF